MNYTKSVALFLVTLFACGYLITPVAAQTAGDISGTFKAANTPPTIVSVTPYTGGVDPTPDGTSSFTVTFRVRDLDGNADIAVTQGTLLFGGSFYRAGVKTSGPIIIDENTIEVSYRADFDHTDAPGDYYFSVYARDSAGGIAGDTAGPIGFTSAIGFTIDGPSTLDFGTLAYGAASQPQTTNIHNSANTVIYIRTTAPDWTSSVGVSAVPANSLTANNVAVNSGAITQGLERPSSQDPTAYQISFVETVPAKTEGFTLAGTYTTTVTLTASS